MTLSRRQFLLSSTAAVAAATVPLPAAPAQTIFDIEPPPRWIACGTVTGRYSCTKPNFCELSSADVQRLQQRYNKMLSEITAWHERIREELNK